MTYLKSCDVESDRGDGRNNKAEDRHRNNDHEESQILLEDDIHKVSNYR